MPIAIIFTFNYFFTPCLLDKEQFKLIPFLIFKGNKTTFMNFHIFEKNFVSRLFLISQNNKLKQPIEKLKNQLVLPLLKNTDIF